MFALKTKLRTARTGQSREMVIVRMFNTAGCRGQIRRILWNRQQREKHELQVAMGGAQRAHRSQAFFEMVINIGVFELAWKLKI